MNPVSNAHCDPVSIKVSRVYLYQDATLTLYLLLFNLDEELRNGQFSLVYSNSNDIHIAGYIYILSSDFCKIDIET